MKSIIIFLVIIVLLTSCDVGTVDCQDQIISSENSPDGKFIACLYERDCGATTDVSTTVNLRQAGDKFNGGEERIFVIKGQAKVQLIWKEPNLLIVKSAAKNTENIFKQEKRWKDIYIQYEAELN